MRSVRSLFDIGSLQETAWSGTRTDSRTGRGDARPVNHGRGIGAADRSLVPAAPASPPRARALAPRSPPTPAPPLRPSFRPGCPPASISCSCAPCSEGSRWLRKSARIRRTVTRTFRRSFAPMVPPPPACARAGGTRGFGTGRRWRVESRRREAPSPCQPNRLDRPDREGSSRKTGLSEPLPYIDPKDQPLGGSLIAGTGIGETSAAWARGYDAPPSPAVWGSSK